MSARTKKTLQKYYELMHAHYGPTHWWPGDTPFEIAVGAILTQNAAWTNVEKAIANLKASNLLGPRKLLNCPIDKLQQALRPSGYFRVKTKRLLAFCDFLVSNYRASIKHMAKEDPELLRAALLNVHGIGPETADDILLYACNIPSFVVDTYTRRILSRHGLVPPTINYDDLRSHFQTNLPPNLNLYKEFHGLIVYTGKDFCRPTPKCETCPLRSTLKRGQPRIE